MKVRNEKPKLVGQLNRYNFRQANRVWSVKGISPVLLATNSKGIGHQINILEEKEDA